MKAIIDNYSCWISETNPLKLQEIFEKLLLDAGFGLLNFMEHNFDPQGYTCIWLLSESHLAVHTFPEESKTYIELSSCNRKMYDDFLHLLKESGLIIHD